MREQIIVPKANKKEDGFYMEIVIEPQDPKKLSELSKQLTKELFPKLMEKIKKEVPEILTSNNFFGAAEEYMFENKIQFSKEIRNKYAKAIYDDFIRVLDDVLVYNTEDGMLYISPYVLDLEFGSFYTPGIHFLSKCIEDYFDDFSKKQRQ
jgi:hypothetical protein